MLQNSQTIVEGDMEKKNWFRYSFSYWERAGVLLPFISH